MSDGKYDKRMPDDEMRRVFLSPMTTTTETSEAIALRFETHRARCKEERYRSLLAAIAFEVTLPDSLRAAIQAEGIAPPEGGEAVNDKRIREAVAEANRFLAAEKALREELKKESPERALDFAICYMPVQSGALRRASMDLTRALARMRRSS